MSCQCMGRQRKVRCSELIQKGVFCDQHHASSRQDYDRYKTASAAFHLINNEHQARQLKGEEADYRQLYAKAAAAATSRSEFAQRHIHMSCHDAGHAHQIETFKQMAQCYECQLAWIYEQRINNEAWKKNKDQSKLKQHRAFLQQCESRRAELERQETALQVRWSQCAYVRRAREKAEQQKLDAKEERSIAQELEETINSVRVEASEQLISIMGQYQGRQAIQKWMADICVHFIGFLVENGKMTPDNMDAILERDQLRACQLLRWWCEHFFGKGIQLYEQKFICLLSDFYHMSPTRIVSRRTGQFDLSITSVFESSLGGVLCLANAEDKARAVQRCTTRDLPLGSMEWKQALQYRSKHMRRDGKQIKMSDWFFDVMQTAREVSDQVPVIAAMQEMEPTSAIDQGGLQLVNTSLSFNQYDQMCLAETGQRISAKQEEAREKITEESAAKSVKMTRAELRQHKKMQDSAKLTEAIFSCWNMYADQGLADA